MLKIIPVAALVVALSSCSSVENILNNTSNRAPTNMTTPAVNAEKGLITMQSSHSLQDTADKLVEVIESKGMKVFAKVDHQKNASEANLSLRPTQVIMFGNPKAGTPLMNCEQTVAIDLPQKILISEDTQQKVWLSYNDPFYLKERHNIQGCDTNIDNISKVLSTIGQEVVAK